MLGKGGKGKKGKGDKKGKGNGKGNKGDSNKDEKDKDQGKGKGKANNKATEYFAGYCLLCKTWGHMKKDCWWNESTKSGKDAASLETPTTPAVTVTTTEPPITGMLIQSDEGEAMPSDPTKWMYSMTKRDSPNNDFLIDSGAATSVCQQSLADTLAGKPRGPGIELKSATGHQFTTTSNTTICLTTRNGINEASDFQIAPKDNGLQRSIISVDKCATEARSSRSAALVERSSTSLLAIELSSNVLVVCIDCELMHRQG